ncbi:isoleucine--tRNA ligase [bacterium]|nr:isoleucine--tRNA ligase [bacterium]
MSDNKTTTHETLKKNFKHTLNLPQTDFPIRAGLARIEPEILEEWEKLDLSNKITKKNANLEDKKSFLLHDGPPYPNGNIHMGHALNKVLKDVVVRYRNKKGFHGRYIPGWDCHGLPIETQVIKALKKSGDEEKKNDVQWFRDECKRFALDYVNTQKDEFKRLGVFAEWDTPYLTLQKEYEAGVIRSFGLMANEGIIYKGRKPIHWCTSCETALAEAEIEYADHRSPSIFVKFPIRSFSEKLGELFGKYSEKQTQLIVWTTTPWTLPSNVAVAAHPSINYVAFESDGKLYIVAEKLKSKLIETLEMTGGETFVEFKGDDIAGSVASHPFIDREAPVVAARYVTEEDGTGFVHLAPGHGQDDYITGLEHKLPMIMPVDDKGLFTEEVQWKGIHVFEANRAICQYMEEQGSLLKIKMIKHSYPHCWRCKSPVIFRATEQWFVAMDKPLKSSKKTLRNMALEAIDDVEWFPKWGKKRITAMITGRPDWCISRQRNWGIPIPVFNCDCGSSDMSLNVIQHVESIIKEEGTMAWVSKPTKELLPDSYVCKSCGGELKKETDILDVWFESGSSFANVVEDRLDHFPADLYLEGSDQHRGWFQSSLLIGLASKGKAPFKQVLTHGFLVDEKGRKMSKSIGNVIAPKDIIRDYGVDILRWWAASTEIKNDVGISRNVFNQARDSFSKVRNTIRFCLSNLYDFSDEADCVEPGELNEIDRWILSECSKLKQDVHNFYESYEFHRLTQSIHHFCTVTLSNQYLDIVKDRLYCSEKTGLDRRSTQTALFYLVETLIKLVAPILVFTSEDAYRFFNVSKKEDSVHLSTFDETNYVDYDDGLSQKWKDMFDNKTLVYKQLEERRKQKEIGSFLETKVSITLEKMIDYSDWESFLIVSGVDVLKGDSFSVTIVKASGEKCLRCWRYEDLNDDLCSRCSTAVLAIGDEGENE